MSEFKREDRYIVLKLKRLPKDEAEYLRDCHPKAMVEGVVVEHDWPEYHLVWTMIEHRMAGKPVPDFNLWRRADALQALLTAADERADVMTTALTRIHDRCKSFIEDDWPMSVESVEAVLGIAEAALKPAEGGGDE